MQLNKITNRLLLIISFNLFVLNVVKAQVKVSGNIKNSTNQESIPGVAVTLLNPRDSSISSGAVSDLDGKFLIETKRNGPFIVKISSIGFTTKFERIIAQGNDIDMGEIKISTSINQLKTAEIDGVQIRSQQKGDTTEFNAKAFKVNPDATAEDLAKKLPGVTIDANGVKAGGETVQKVLIDGQEYFGDDASAALKNLPAEVVDKIQVFDKLSDQAQFTGFDDGNSRKTMNIVTKAGLRNAQFGKFYAGGGTDERYNTGVNLNLFKGARRLTLLGQSNNINVQNFSSQDLLGLTAGGATGGPPGGRGGGGGGGMGRMMNMVPGSNDPSNFMVGQQNGINTTHSFGINYQDSIGKKIKIGGSYFFNNSANKTDKSIDRNQFLNDTTTQNYIEDNNSWANNLNHRLNLRVEVNFDTSNSIIYTPRINWQGNLNGSLLNGETFRNTINKINQTNTDNLNNNTGYSNGHNLLIRHKFKKAARTISVTLNTDLSEKYGEINLQSTNFIFNPDTSKKIAQLTNSYSNSKVYSANVMYTEPLGKIGQLFLTYAPSYTMNYSEKIANQQNPITSAYTRLDSTLSNKFDNIQSVQRGGAGIRIRTPRTMLVLNANVQSLDLKSAQTFPLDFAVNRNFVNVLPFAMMNYKFSSSTNIRIFYRSNTNIPSLTQLQNVPNNNNPLQLSIGNADLKQEFSQSLNFRFGTANTKTSRALFINAGGSLTNNYIGNSTTIASKDTVVFNNIFLRNGSQITQPTNLNGYVNLNSLITYSFPVKIIKSTLNIQTGVNYSKTPGNINGINNNTQNYAYSGGLVLASNISEKIDFTLSYNGGLNEVSNTLQPQLNNNYVIQTAGFKGNWLPWKGFVLNSEITHYRYDGLGAAFNQRYWLWNAAIGYKFLKNNAAEFRISAFDLLNQNTNISRTVTETYIEDNRTRVLNRYFLLSFSYTLRNYGVGNKNK
jgi:hypothetical protein